MTQLKIAIQKSGRLNEDSLNILKEAGISVSNGLNQLKSTASNFPLEILFLRNSDIPQYLIDGVVDIAIVGENLLVEKGDNIAVLEKVITEFQQSEQRKDLVDRLRLLQERIEEIRCLAAYILLHVGGLKLELR